VIGVRLKFFRIPGRKPAAVDESQHPGNTEASALALAPDPTPDEMELVPETDANPGAAEASGTKVDVRREPFPEEPGDLRFVGPKPPSYPVQPTSAPDGAGIISGAVDTALDGFTAGAMTVRAVSVKGDRHRHYGEPRQDSFVIARAAGIGTTPHDGIVVAVVADGVGSATLSHVGAAIACERVAASVLREHSEFAKVLVAGDTDDAKQHLTRAIDDVCAALNAAAAEAGLAATEVSTTLRGVVASTDPDLLGRLSFQIGDGGTYRLSGTEWKAVDAEPIDGPIHSTATHALPDHPEQLHVQWWESATDEVIVVGTDGFTGPLGTSEFAALLAEAWGGSAVPDLLRFAWQAQTRARSYDDDRTVAVLWHTRKNVPHAA